jgi:hypothetical protein
MTDLESDLETLKAELSELHGLIMANRKAISACAAMIGEFQIMLMQFDKQEADVH